MSESKISEDHQQAQQNSESEEHIHIQEESVQSLHSVEPIVPEVVEPPKAMDLSNLTGYKKIFRAKPNKVFGLQLMEDKTF